MMEAFSSDFNRKFKNDEVAAYHQFYDNALALIKSSELEVFDLRVASQFLTPKRGISKRRLRPIAS